MLYLALSAFGLVGEVTLVGRLTFADVLLVTALPYLAIVKRGSIPSRSVIQFYAFSLMWFVGAMATDLVRGTPIDDVFRGWSKIAFFVLNFTSMWLMINGNRYRAVTFVFLVLVALVIRLRVQTTNEFGEVVIGSDFFGDAWRFGNGTLLAGAVFVLSALLLGNPMTKVYGLILPFLDAVFNLSLNARNLFGQTALAGLVVALTFGSRRALSPVYIIGIAVVAGIAGWGSVSAYSYAASAGMLGVDAQEKYERQSSGALGILVGGRSESLASTQAIFDSPILGHGSWARDIYYVNLMVSRLEQAGYELQGDPFEDDLIPSHSHLFGAWVEAGILGALFWAWATYVTIRGVYVALRQPTPLSGFVVFMGLSLLWDIFFSPFGLERRVATTAVLVLMIIWIDDEKQIGSQGLSSA